MSPDFDIERRHFENLCHIHKTDLWHIIHGRDPYRIFNVSERERLLDAGILEGKRKKLGITEKAVVELSRKHDE